MSRLKPCPFCGEKLEIIANGQYYSHKREENSEKQCFGAVWVFPIDDEEMIRRWNTRKPMDKVVEQLEELKDKALKRREELIELNSYNNIILKNIEYERGREYAFDDAIDIAKAGGIDES